jgi:protoporphyrinogen oxidase
MNLILGAGLAGISASYHIGHHKCLVLEKNPYCYGHIHSQIRDGFTWDEGPHVSFTKHDYVRDLFAKSVNEKFEEYPVRVVNYFQGQWIDHPAQSNLYQLADPLRTKCLDSFLASRATAGTAPCTNYQAWLEQAFGTVFANTFPAAYTRKYWTVEPAMLTTDWVGERIFLPKVEDVVVGAKKPLERQTHYITHVRYPTSGGFESFARSMASGMQVRCNAEVKQIDLLNKRVRLADNTTIEYSRLINTMPLPDFVMRCIGTPSNVLEAAKALSCTRLLIVNVTAPHPTQIDGNWFYIYDEDKYSTRINCTERLSPNNAPEGHTGIQVEVYSSKYKSLCVSPEDIARSVINELCEMGFLRPELLPNGMNDIKFFTHEVPWANVIFDHERRSALETIWQWLEEFGLKREKGDLDPTTDWDTAARTSGQIVMAGRFAQWKYFWTDDCVLRGRQMEEFSKAG